MSSLVLLLIAGVVGWILYKAQAQDGPSSSAPRYSDDQVQRCDAWLKACADTVQLPRMICGPVPDCFGHDEDVFAVFPVTLMESRAVRYSRSNYGGPTIRIMKGFSYRFGSSVGQSESVEEMRTLDSGTLVVTTKRLAFVGSIRTNSTDLNDVISVEDYSDGIRVHREHKQKAETYVLDSTPILADGGGSGLPVGGFLMAKAIGFGKIFRQATPQQLAQLRRENAATLPPPTTLAGPNLTLVK